MQPKYTAVSIATGSGREGKVKSTTGKVDYKLSLPKDLGGDEIGTNPEELFSAGYASCFLGALQAVARNKKVTLPEGTTVEVHIGIGEDVLEGGFKLIADIKSHIPGMPDKEAEELTHLAHAFCPYSKATKNNIKHTVQHIVPKK